LSRGMQVVGAAWGVAMRAMEGVGDLVQMTGNGHTGRVLDGRAVGLGLKPRSTVCEWFGLKTTRTIFTDLASKPMATIPGGLASKPAVTISSGLASKPAVMVFAGLASKPVTTVFSSLASKLVAIVSPSLVLKPVVGFLVEPQSQGGGGFPGLGLKTGSFDLVIWASKSPRRFLGLGFKTKWASVCRLRHKTDGGRSTQDIR
jgi:hypothetical protein